MPETLEPLVFIPRLVPKLWGGDRLRKILGKTPPPSLHASATSPTSHAAGAGGAGGIGEAWEVYDFPPGTVEGNKDWLSSIVAEGSLKGASLHELVTKHTDALLGDKKPLETDSGEKQFPLLIKFLDAREDLSIQVHPTPEYVKGHKGVGAYLKTECWIVVDNAKGSFLYKGLKPGVTREQFEAALKGDGHNVKDLIATVPAREGDCHFLPSGVIHALGAGTLVAEVQTPSDTTYRVYDFNRIEAATGKPRTLHINQALECIDFAGTPTPAVTNTRNTQIPLVKCEFFETRSIKAPAHTIRPLPKGEMKIWMVTEGVVRLKWAGKKLDVNLGQTVLLPAHVPPGLMASFPGNASYIETVLP